MNKTKLFKVGDFCFSLTYPAEITPPDNFMLFEVPGGNPAYHYTFMLADRISVPKCTPTARRADALIYNEGGLESRLIGTRGEASFYAFYKETGNDSAEIIYAADRVQDLIYDTMFSSLFAFERHLLPYDSLILHCAYMNHYGKAVLFSAPSGTGKSTQAGLWKTYRGRPTVNGDRGLIERTENGWSAHGWPVCGSSGICHNKSMPIRAIVMLAQAKENRVVRLHGIEAFRLIYSQVTINKWNNALVTSAIDLIEKLISEVPVFLLACDISENAVICLENALGND